MIKLPDIYFLPEWGKLFQEHDQGEACVFEFKNESGHIYYQFIKKVVPNNSYCSAYYDIVSTYGFNGPIILADDSTNKELLIYNLLWSFNNIC